MRLTHLLERLKRKQFISIGRVAMDFYVEPPGTVLEHADNFSVHVGGSAGKVKQRKPLVSTPRR
jgi:uracil-DNA glycosylase